MRPYFRQMFRILFLCALCMAIASPCYAAGEEDHLTTGQVVIAYKFRVPVKAQEGRGGTQPGDDAASYGTMYILTGDGMRYELTADTAITGTTGEKLDANRLPIPCEAEITSQELMSGYSNAVQIQILRLGPGASPTWSQLPD